MLITSHDAFHYFGRAYGFEVVGIQGISTDTEAGLKAITDAVDLIRSRQIRAIFPETSVPRAAIERVAKDGQCRLGPELYSDALGAPDSPAGHIRRHDSDEHRQYREFAARPHESILDRHTQTCQSAADRSPRSHGQLRQEARAVEHRRRDPEGQIVGIIGPNGAGKSTLIKAMMGLMPAESGWVKIYGEPLARQRRLVGYVPQRESVDWDFPSRCATSC